jgi:hypothetical protein
MSTAPLQTLATKSQPSGNSSHTSLVLRRKCACGSPTSSLTGECAECKSKKRLQTKRRIGASNDPLEREADRVADQVTGNASPASPPVSSLASGRLQRQEAPKEKTDQEKYQEGLEKLGEAFLKTPLGKELLEKLKQDALVKGATELGKDFISTWPGKIVTGAAATGAVAALAATHKELPAQIPEIPLDIVTPGLSVQLTYKGPVDKPTEAMITFKFTEQAPKASGDRKPLSASEKFRAETARLAAENAKFRAGMTYQPGSPEDLQQKAEQEAIRKAVLKSSGGPDIEGTIKKYPWLATPQPKSGLQLTMPRPSFGIQPPSLLGDEFKLKLPGEQKKKDDEPVLQKKLSIGASNDPLEQEADLVAEQVMAIPAGSSVSRAPLQIQRYTAQATDHVEDAAPSSVDRVLARSGQPLEPSLRQDMEQRFGHDFSRVRVHSGTDAALSAQEVNAHAYTVGADIVFGQGGFSSQTQSGRHLLAHELTHVVQQESGGARRAVRRFHLPHGADPEHQYDETSDIAPTFNDLLSSIKAVIKAATLPGGFFGDTVNMDLLVQNAGGFSAGTALDEKLGTNSTPEKSSLLNYRYLFTCRCGLVDMRHFFQLMYISNFVASAFPGSNGNRAATKKGREHELQSESESRFGAEDTTSNAMGAFTGARLAATPTPGDLFSEIETMLRRCGPVDFASVSPASKNMVTQHYGGLTPDPAPKAAGDMIPAHSNQTAIPDILSIPECSGKERSFPFKLDSNDPDRKTIAGTAFDSGSSGLTSDSEIRDFLSTQRVEIIKNLPATEKVRLSKRLFGGWVDNSDINAIEVIYKNSSDAEKTQIRAAINISDLSDVGQRSRLKLLFS